MKPPMTGALRLQTNLVLPPGDTDVVEKLRLDGRFSIDNGRFTDAEVQHKINEMSLRASGKLKAAPKPPVTSVRATGTAAPPVVSDFQGRSGLRSAASSDTSTPRIQRMPMREAARL